MIYLSGEVIRSGNAIIIHDANEDKRHDKTIEMNENYVSHTILMVPIFDENQKLIGKPIKYSNSHKHLNHLLQEFVKLSIKTKEENSQKMMRLYYLCSGPFPQRQLTTLFSTTSKNIFMESLKISLK